MHLVPANFPWVYNYWPVEQPTSSRLLVTLVGGAGNIHSIHGAVVPRLECLSQAYSSQQINVSHSRKLEVLEADLEDAVSSHKHMNR